MSPFGNSAGIVAADPTFYARAITFGGTGYPVIVVLPLIIIWDAVQFRHSGLAGRQPRSLGWQFWLKTDIEILKQCM